MTSSNMWEYGHGEQNWADRKLVGYKVEALDGGIGKVDDASTDVGANSIVVDTGPWIFGQKVMLPAGLIERVDHDDEKIFVSSTKDQIKNSPQYTDTSRDDVAYRQQLGDYYDGTGRSDRTI